MKPFNPNKTNYFTFYFPQFYKKLIPLRSPVPDCMPIFRIMPIAMEQLTIELIPLLKNGSGNPVFGKIIEATPIFAKT